MFGIPPLDDKSRDETLIGWSAETTYPEVTLTAQPPTRGMNVAAARYCQQNIRSAPLNILYSWYALPSIAILRF
jgi:hypothetical protein